MKASADSIYTTLDEKKALPVDLNKQNDMFINSSGEVALRSDLEALVGVSLDGAGSVLLPTYNETNVETVAQNYTGQIAIAEMAESTAEMK